MFDSWMKLTWFHWIAFLKTFWSGWLDARFVFVKFYSFFGFRHYCKFTMTVIKVITSDRSAWHLSTFYGWEAVSREFCWSIASCHSAHVDGFEKLVDFIKSEWYGNTWVHYGHLSQNVWWSGVTRRKYARWNFYCYFLRFLMLKIKPVCWLRPDWLPHLIEPFQCCEPMLR